MDTLSTNFIGGIHYMRSGEEEEEEGEEEEEEDAEEKNEEKESSVQKQQKPAWTPCFYIRADKDVYYYAGQEISIEGVLDSYAGTVWPAAVALSHYLDTHRQQPSLVDKTVLEIGAGTGLVAIVAALLGAWVTATDLPEVLNVLRVNLSRNTRQRCRYTPQVAALSWGHDLERTFPSSVYQYDYLLAADVVYHHDFLDELLVTMKHFCKPGTTVIWANRVRFETDLTFTENFKKAFHTSLLVEDGEMKIFMATCREEEGDGNVGRQDQLREEEEVKQEVEKAEDEKKEERAEDEYEDEYDEEERAEETEEEEESNKNLVEEQFHVNSEESKGKQNNVTEDTCESEEMRDDEEEGKQCESDGEEDMEEKMVLNDDDDDNDEDKDEEEKKTDSEEDVTGQALIKPADQGDRTPIWVSSTISSFGRDVYHYAGQDIVIHESIDCFGAVMWPAALALCSFLDNNRQKVNLQGKEVLELGAGTGLVTIVASLLGAAVTATDLPEVLGNLRANVMRNTRQRCRYTPQVAALSWGHDLERNFPSSVHRYDYLLAADVVYHHDFLDELLVTMKHFCKPGTTVIWANRVRFETDLKFTENFKKAFHTSLLVEDGEMKIFMATCRD